MERHNAVAYYLSIFVVVMPHYSVVSAVVMPNYPCFWGQFGIVQFWHCEV